MAKLTVRGHVVVRRERAGPWEYVMTQGATGTCRVVRRFLFSDGGHGSYGYVDSGRPEPMTALFEARVRLRRLQMEVPT